MPINIRVFGKKELVQKYKRIAATMPSVITEEMSIQMKRLADYVRTSKLSGDPLNRRSGKLSRSIAGSASASGTKITGIVFSKGVPYAHVHEDGGMFEIPSHTRMMTMAFGKPIVARQVTVAAHNATFPQRAFLKPSLNEKSANILDAIRQRVLETMRAA